jgi:hypothetical protein
MENRNRSTQQNKEEENYPFEEAFRRIPTHTKKLPAHGKLAETRIWRIVVVRIDYLHSFLL